MILLKASKEIIDLAEKIKKHRTEVKLIEELKLKNESLELQIKDLEENIKVLKINTIEQNKLLKQIKELEQEKKKLKLDVNRLDEAYAFVVTTPNETTNTVYGEISRELSTAKKEILICSPWITHIIEEFSRFKKKETAKINIRIITRLIKEDIEKGVTDLDKFRVLKNVLGADVRYNNDLHAKMMIIDNSIAIISSANLTKKGLTVNYEAGLCIRDKKNINKATEFFNEVWKKSNPLTEEAIQKVISK